MVYANSEFLTLRVVDHNDGCEEAVLVLRTLLECEMLDEYAQPPIKICSGVTIHCPLSEVVERNLAQADRGKGYPAIAARHRLRQIYRWFEALDTDGAK